MVNMCRNIIQANINDWGEKDAVIFLTLEDDIYKLCRRFTSIFGNYKFETIKTMFKKSYEITRADQNNNSDNNENIKNKLESMFLNVLNSSIARITDGKVNLIVKHCNENSFSAGDLGRFMDTLKVNGYNPKFIFCDYIDVMVPTVNRYTNSNDYDNHGAIVQELRNLSRIHKVPVITATQNKRDSEKITGVMSNDLIGDSYKKVRYADFVYMCRMRNDLTILNENVKKNVIIPDVTGELVPAHIIQKKDILDQLLVPFEVKITKAKESGRDVTRFFLFCKENLKIYNSVQEYLVDSPHIDSNTKRLEKDISIITDLAISSITIQGSGIDDVDVVNNIPEFKEMETAIDLVREAVPENLGDPFEGVGFQQFEEPIFLDGFSAIEH